MTDKATYEELEQRIKELEKEAVERKQAEEAVQEREKKYRQIFENIQDVYYEASLDGIILEVSPSIANISQYTRQDLIGKSLYDIYANPEERDALVKAVLEKEKIGDFEITLTDKDGSQHACSIVSVLVRDDEGNPVKIIGSMRDISERKRAEDALQEREDFFKQMFEQSKTSIEYFDPEGYCIKVNPKFCELFGVEAEVITDGRYNIFEDQSAKDAGILDSIREIFEEKKQTGGKSHLIYWLLPIPRVRLQPEGRRYG